MARIIFPFKMIAVSTVLMVSPYLSVYGYGYVIQRSTTVIKDKNKKKISTAVYTTMSVKFSTNTLKKAYEHIQVPSAAAAAKKGALMKIESKYFSTV